MGQQWNDGPLAILLAIQVSLVGSVDHVVITRAATAVEDAQSVRARISWKRASEGANFGFSKRLEEDASLILYSTS